MTPTSSEISERRRLAAIGIKAGKSKRLIARELGVTATTISRYLEVLGITANKKPTATRRKPALVWKGSSPATSDSKVAAQNRTKRIKLRPRPVFTRRVVPEPLKPGPPKPLSPAKPLRPEQLRRQRLEEMLQLVGSWFVEQEPRLHASDQRPGTFGQIPDPGGGQHHPLAVSQSPLTNFLRRRLGRPDQRPGTLVITNLGGTELKGGDTFTLFRAGSYSGDFAGVVLPP